MATTNLKNTLEPGKSIDKKKTVVVGAVAVILVVILLSFFVGRQQFAGKAIYVEVASPSLSVTGDLSTTGSITINADVGSKTMTGATFDLTLPVACSAVTIQDLFGGLLAGAGRSFTCTDQNLHFDDGMLSGTKTGQVQLVKITFTSAPTLPASLQFTRFEVGDQVNQYTTPTLPAAFNCQATSCTMRTVASGPVCGNDAVTLPEVCDDGNTVTETSCLYGTATCTACNAGCTATLSLMGAYCGDRTIQSPETCDDGNIADGDGCSSICAVEAGACPTCQTVQQLFAASTQLERVDLCRVYGISAITCPGTSTFNADINSDGLIDDRDALFIFQAIEAKQSAYNYCGASTQPPCVFSDRAICEDVSYVWTASTSITSAPTLPTPATSNTLSVTGIVCGSLEAGSP